jgi:hypothetical protein
MAYTESVRLRAVGAVVSTAAAAWTACAVYDASLLLPAVATDASADALDRDADAGPPLARWPGRPATEDGTQDIELVAAFRTIAFEASDASAPLGYDLDGVVTCPGPGSCKAPNKDPCDDALGRDNAGGQLIAQLSAFTNEFSASQVNRRIGEGQYGAVMRVRGYNGGQNDAKVSVAFYVSTGTTNPTPDAGGDAGRPPPPVWAGSDRWDVDSNTLLGGASLVGTDCDARPNDCVPRNVDTNAYVSGGVLVAALDVPLQFGSASRLSLDLTGAVVVARLTPAGSSYRLDGQVVGRWSTQKLLTSLASANDPFSKDPLCGANPTYQNIKALICQAADIPGDPTKDGKGETCDALSVALAFTAEAAKMGKVQGRGTPTPGCDAGYSDSCR